MKFGYGRSYFTILEVEAWLFSLSTLKISFHCLLASTISFGNSAVSLIVLLKIMGLSRPLLAFRIFSLSLIFKSFTMFVEMWGSPFLPLLVVHLFGIYSAS